MARTSTSGGELRALRDRIAAMAKPPFQTRVAQLCAAAAMKKIADGFRESRDQEGHPWLPLASRRGKPLLDTGRLRASYAVEPIAGGFRIGTAVAYAGYHQFGTRPRHVASRAARQNARGRFVGKRARTGYLLRIRAHENRGIPARPMLPVNGVPPSWSEAFALEINRAVRRELRGGAA